MADHPIHLVRRFLEKVENGHYREIGLRAADKYRHELSDVDPYDRLAQVYATKVRLGDKLALINALVARAIGSTSDLSDDEAMSILVGWATIEGKRWRPIIENDDE